MQIVIDIDEDTYKDIKRGKIYTSVRDVPQESVVAIANGKPLPKGHGRLIDADELRRTMKKDVRKAMSFVDLTDFVWLAPTIVEADKEEE